VAIGRKMLHHLIINVGQQIDRLSRPNRNAKREVGEAARTERRRMRALSVDVLHQRQSARREREVRSRREGQARGRETF